MAISRILGIASLGTALVLGAAPALAAEQDAQARVQFAPVVSGPDKAPYYGTGCSVYMTATDGNYKLRALGYNSTSGAFSAPLGKLGLRPTQYTIRKITNATSYKVTTGWMKYGRNLYYVKTRLYPSGASGSTRTRVSTAVGNWKDLTFSGKYLYSLDTSGRIVRWTVDSYGRLTSSNVRLTGQYSSKNLTYGVSGYNTVNGVRTGTFDTLYSTTTGGALKRFHVRTSGQGWNNSATLKSSGFGAYTSIGVGGCAGDGVAILGHSQTYGTGRLYIDADWSAGTSDISNKGIVGTGWKYRSYGG